MISAVNLLQRYSPHEIKHFEDRLHVQKKSSQNWFAPSPLNRLTDAITDPKRLSAARKTIGPSAQAIFRYIVLQGGCVFPDEIERHFPSSEPALRRLKEEFLVFESLFRKTKTEQVPLLVIPSELAQTLTLNEEEERTLGIFLAHQNSAQLSCIAAALGVERAGVSSLQSAFIRRMLLDPTALRKRVSAWTVQERKLFELAVARDGFLDIQELERLGYRQILVPAGYGELTLSGAAATLYLKACLFPVPQRSPRFLLMPSDLLSLWRGPSPAVATLVASSETPEHLRSWGLRILSDLRLWSAYQSSGRVRVTQKAIPEKKAVHSFLKALDVHEYAYGLFLNHAMEAFYGVVPKGCADPLGNSPTEALGKLIVHWKKSIVWQESHEERDTRLARHVGSDNALTTRREIFMSLLKRLPDGAWGLERFYRRRSSGGMGKGAMEAWRILTAL